MVVIMFLITAAVWIAAILVVYGVGGEPKSPKSQESQVETEKT